MTDAIADAAPAPANPPRAFLYAGPFQTLQLRVAAPGEGDPPFAELKLVPGRVTRPLDPDDQVVAGMIAQGFLVDPPVAAPEATPLPAITADEARAEAGMRAVGDPLRLALIADAAGAMTGDALTRDGRPKVEAMSAALGFETSADEIRQALAEPAGETAD